MMKILVFLTCWLALCSSSTLMIPEVRWEKIDSKIKNMHQSFKSKTSTDASSDTSLKSSLGDPKKANFLPSPSLRESGDFLSYRDTGLAKKTFLSQSNLHPESITGGERESPFRKWEQRVSRRVGHEINRNETNEKEIKIAQIFMGVAYGRKAKNKDQRKLKPVFVNNYYSTSHSEKNRHSGEKIYKKKYFVENYAKPSEPSEILSKPKRVQKSVKKYKVKTLVQEDKEDLLKNIDFSLPQLFLSPEENNSEVGFYYPKPSLIYKAEQRNISLNFTNMNVSIDLDIKDDMKFNTSLLMNVTLTTNYGSDPKVVIFNHSSLYFDHDYLNWTYIHLNHSPRWQNQDTFILVFFCMISILPLIVIFHLEILKRDHATPKYCLLLMLQLLIVCWNRIFLYSVDPFGENGRLPQFIISVFHIIAQSLLICSVGLFFVILVFPVYRPKSHILPKALCLFLILLLLTKSIAFSVYIFRGDFRLLKTVQMCITGFDFGEIGTLVIGYIFLNLCTKQRHKIWWIRLYRKSLNSNNRKESFSVLYSFLKRSIRLGTAAALILLFNIFWKVNVSFNLKLVYASLSSEPLLCWILETTKRFFEGLVCCLLVFGACYLFVPKERVIIRKRSSLKSFTDIIKGRRRSESQSSVGKMMQPLSIFTLNKNRKATDCATTDFQLVWNQNHRTLNGNSVDRSKSVKSLNFFDEDYPKKISKDLKVSHSVDILNSVYEPKHPATNFSIYDNLEQNKDRTPIYQNQYFHYNYQPQLYDGSATVHNVFKSNQSITSNVNKLKNKKKQRPKSCFVEERSKVNDNYLTSYFSVLTMDKYMEDGTNWSKSYSNHMDKKESFEKKGLLPDEVNSSRMISNDQWKDINITPKSCTIKINPKNMRKNLPISKSVDLF